MGSPLLARSASGRQGIGPFPTDHPHIAGSLNMGARPKTPAQAQRLLAERGAMWWREGDAKALEAACAAVPNEALSAWPDVARWRALVALMHEQGDALSCLELAYEGHLNHGHAQAAGIDASIALLLCVIDIGAMDRVTDWLERAGAIPTTMPMYDHTDLVWVHAGSLARAILGDATAPDVAVGSRWLHDQLRPLQTQLSPNERVIAAQVLVEFHYGLKQYEQLDVIATAVDQPALFEAASPVMQARLLHALGFTHYHIGNATRAEEAWQRTLDIANMHNLVHMRLLTSLAMLRLLLDRGRIVEAERIEAAIRPQWGAGRDSQLIHFKQMSARLLLMREQPVRALATLNEALALVDQAKLGAPDRASCLTDLVQVLIANKRATEALELLGQLVREYGDRDGEVFRCLLELLHAWRDQPHDEGKARTSLQAGLRRAQQVRYTMFFRLLPGLASEVCALALRWQVEPTFVFEVIRTRDLPAPAEADERWPWVLYLRMLGGFELRLRGKCEPHKSNRKAQKKPLELLRAMACQREMTLSAGAAADAMWPDADGDPARKSLETTVQRLRRLLGDDDNSLVLVSDGQVALDSQRVSSDVIQRRALIRRMEALALHPDAAHEAVALALRIAELGGGRLLPSAADAPWLETERRRCERDELRAQRAFAAVAASSQTNATDKALLEVAARSIMAPA